MSKEFRFVEPVFIDGYDGKRWISCSLPWEETTPGDKYKVQFRPHGREDLPWETHIATLYVNRLTDQNLLDVPMEREGVQEWDKYDVIVTKYEDRN